MLEDSVAQRKMMAEQNTASNESIKHIVNIVATRLGNAVPGDLRHAVPNGINAVQAQTRCFSVAPPTHPAHGGGHNAQQRNMAQRQLPGPGMRAMVRRTVADNKQGNGKRLKYENKDFTKYQALSNTMKAHYATTHNISDQNAFDKRANDLCMDCGDQEADHRFGHCLKGWFSTRDGQEYKGIDS